MYVFVHHKSLLFTFLCIVLGSLKNLFRFVVNGEKKMIRAYVH